MEDSETCIWPAHAALAPSFSGMGRLTLNEDPSNVLAEQLAMDHCTKGFDVVQLLSETELVVTSCGSMIPGTPDGGFIDSNGLLRLVQVVRVPLLPGMDASTVADTLYDTVLTKIVKSQAWMRQTGVLPHDFTIFCWLPMVGSYEVCLEQGDELLWTESLISNVRSGGWPFSLRVEVPEDPGGMFPTFFGQTSKERKSYAEDLLYFLSPSDFEASDDDEEVMEWYLFDEELPATEDASMATEASTQRDPAVTSALVKLAIQYILESAAGNIHAANVNSFGDHAYESAALTKKLDEASPSLRCEHFDHEEHYQAREKPSGLPLIHGIEWWDCGSSLHAKPRDARLRVLGLPFPLRAPMMCGSMTTAVLDSNDRRCDGGKVIEPVICGHPRTQVVQIAPVNESCRSYHGPAFDAHPLCFRADAIQNAA